VNFLNIIFNCRCIRKSGTVL